MAAFSIGRRDGPDGQKKKRGEAGVDGSSHLGEHSDRPLFFHLWNLLGGYWVDWCNHCCFCLLKYLPLKGFLLKVFSKEGKEKG